MYAKKIKALTRSGLVPGIVALAFSILVWACATGSTDAEVPTCGDGIVEEGEVCDDGNLDMGDGCDKSCQVEPGYACDGEPSICVTTCGNGLADAGEECDASDLAGSDCTTFGYLGGDLGCLSNCVYDTSACLLTVCGNGQVDTGEECDGVDMGSGTCEGLGYDGGALACTLECEHDTSGCTLASCGNGIIDANETCDDANTTPGDGCSANCSVESGWECHGEPSTCSLLCGNGSLDSGEQCDGSNLGGQTCVGLGYDSGTLACQADCQFDTGNCELSTCGNGVIDPPEQCDGVDLNNETCETVGPYIGGTLLCNQNCAFDVSNCIPIVCGDGVISAGEACDDGNTQSGDGCNILCNIEAGWECSGEPSNCTPLCGNGNIDPNEECDTSNLNGETCQSLNFDTGTLACDANCNFDTSQCSMFTCGDGTAHPPGEECDGTDLNGQTCVDVGPFVGGTLLCTGNCTFDTSNCIPIQCGDGIISAGEQCDDNNTASGDGCNAVCQVEVGWVCNGQPSVCVPSCGNHVKDPGEDCDDQDLGGETCIDQGFAGGTLACDANCDFDTSGCLASVCPNGVREGSEECDGSDLNNMDCTDFGYSGGTLACTGSCTFDTSGCSNAVCGNSVVEAGEQCDDGNTNDGDGCSSTCQWAPSCTAQETINCNSWDYDDAWGLSNDIDHYSSACGSWNATTDDKIYSFVPSNSGNASVDLYIDDWDDDFDLFILEGACHPELCIDYSASVGNDFVTFPVIAGMTYYIVVEIYSFWSTWGDYDLHLTCP